MAAANLERAGVDDRVEIVVGAALDTLPRLADRGERFDMFFIDADKENNVGLRAVGGRARRRRAR